MLVNNSRCQRLDFIAFWLTLNTIFLLYAFCTDSFGESTKRPLPALDPLTQSTIDQTVKKAKENLNANFFEQNRQQYVRSREKAFIWIQNLEMDPIQIQKDGFKGKKVFAEMLGGYLNFYHLTSDENQKAKAVERVKELKKITDKPEYHDLASVSPTVLQAGSMSYFRVLWIFEKFGLDTSRYRREILKVKDKLDSHLSSRGLWQRQMFARYYDVFGLKKPEAIANLTKEQGMVENRVPAIKYNMDSAYKLTHEVYVAFDYGLETKQTAFSNEDLIYLREILVALADKYVKEKKSDILGEIISNMTYLGFTKEPSYFEAIRFLLQKQNGDGSWGTYKNAEARYGKYAKQGVYLHTTTVVIASLLEAFERWGNMSIS